MTVTRAALYVTLDRHRTEVLAARLTEMLGHPFTSNEYSPGVFHMVPAPEFEEAYYAHWMDYYRGAVRMFGVLNPEL